MTADGHLRSSLASLERAVRLSALSANATVDNADGSQILQRIAGIVIALLAVTNVMTWRTLVSERAVHQEAELQRPRDTVQTLSTWPARANPWDAVRQMTRNSVPISVPQRAVGSIETLTASPTTGNAVNSAALNARLLKGMADPKAHDALREQQKGSALQLYGELLERWHLSGQTATPILDALAEHELKIFTSAVAGDSSGVDINAADEETLQAILTQKQLEELRAFDASLSDRTTIAPFVSELQLEGTALPADRVEQLVGIMHEERVAVPPPDAPLPTQATTAYGEAMDQWQVALDQRIRDRAALIFSPDLMSRLEIFQNSQRTANSVFAMLAPETARPSAPSMVSDSD